MTELTEVQRRIQNRNALVESNLDFLMKGIYVNNPLNRMLGRVGATYGSDVSKIIQMYAKVETIHQHSDGQGNWTNERQAIHQGIVKKMFGNSKKGRKQPVATLLVGGPGSGKSFVYESFFKTQSQSSVYINADDAKEALPEFDRFKKIDIVSASSKVHEESSHIAHMAIRKAIKEKHNLTIDAVMGNDDKAKKTLDELIEAGYKIRVIGVMVKPSKAVYSAVKRGHDKGRLVPQYIVRAGNSGARNTFKQILKRGRVDSISLFDNNGLNQKKRPQMIIKDNTIKNSTLLAKFMKS